MIIAAITSLLLLAAPHAAEPSGFTRFYNEWLSIPGFEAWKFVNLAIFLFALGYILRTRLSTAFKNKREEIRADLIRAEQRKQEALARLTDIEAKVAQLDAEKAAILERAKAEAEADEKDLAELSAADIARSKDQTQAELGRLANQSRSALRRFSAEESVRLAEERLRSRIDASTDSKLINSGIAEIGGLN